MIGDTNNLQPTPHLVSSETSRKRTGGSYREQTATRSSRIVKQTIDDMLFNDFNIANEPDKKLRKVYLQKQSYLTKQIPEKNRSAIHHQVYALPVMMQALAYLKDNYQQWDELAGNKRDLKELKNRITIQHKNLNELSQLCDQFTTKINALVLVALNSDEIRDLEAYLKGDKKFSESDIKEFAEFIREKISLIENAENPPSPPIPALADQVAFFDLERQALSQSQAQADLLDEQLSTHPVTFIRNDQGDVVAVYKQGAGASNIMEKLIWDLAEVTGERDLYIETKQSRVRTKSELEGGKEKGIVWNQGQPEYKTDLKPAKKGSFQTFENAIKLRDWMSLKDPKVAIDRKAIQRTVVHARRMGYYDFHDGNVFITKEGEFKLFDNTRALPLTNGIQRYLEGYRIPFRCGLLRLPEVFEPFTPEDRAFLKQEIEKAREAYLKTKAYFTLASTKALIKKLPDDWLDSERVLLAMEERLGYMEEAINNPKVNNLRDFLFDTQPNARFAYALQLLYSRQTTMYQLGKGVPTDLKQLQLDTISAVGFYDLIDLIEPLADRNFNVQQILEISENQDCTFEEMLMQIGLYAVEIGEGGYSLEDPYVQKDIVLRKLCQRAVLEAKDMDNMQAEWQRKDFHQVRENYQVEQLKLFADHGIDFEDKSEEIKSASYPFYYFSKDDSTPPRVFFHAKNETDEIFSDEVDYLSQPGEIIVGEDIQGSVSDLLDNLAPAYFWSSSSKASDFLRFFPSRWLLTPAEEPGKHLLLSNDGSYIHTHILEPRSPTEFILNQPGLAPIIIRKAELESFMAGNGFTSLEENQLIAEHNLTASVYRRMAEEGVHPQKESAEIQHWFRQAPGPAYYVGISEHHPPYMIVHYKDPMNRVREGQIHYVAGHASIYVSGLPLSLGVTIAAIPKLMPPNYLENHSREQVKELLAGEPNHFAFGHRRNGTLFMAYHTGTQVNVMELQAIQVRPGTLQKYRVRFNKNSPPQELPLEAIFNKMVASKYIAYIP